MAKVLWKSPTFNPVTTAARAVGASLLAAGYGAVRNWWSQPSSVGTVPMAATYRRGRRRFARRPRTYAARARRTGARRSLRRRRTTCRRKCVKRRYRRKGKCCSPWNILKNLQQPQSYTWNHQATETAGAGHKNWHQLTMGHRNDFANILQVYTPVIGQTPTALLASQVQFESAFCKINMTNNSALPLTGAIYVYKAKKDHDLSVGKLLGNWASTPHMSANDIGSITDVRLTPYCVPEIKSYWRHLRRIPFKLLAGETKSRTFKLRLGKVKTSDMSSLPKSDLYPNWPLNPGTAYKAGRTIQILIGFHGAPGHSTTTKAAAYCPATLDLFAEHHYRWRNYPANVINRNYNAHFEPAGNLVAFMNTGLQVLQNDMVEVMDGTLANPDDETLTDPSAPSEDVPTPEEPTPPPED